MRPEGHGEMWDQFGRRSEKQKKLSALGAQSAVKFQQRPVQPPAGGPAERPDVVVCLINEQAYERPPRSGRGVKRRIVGEAKIVAKPDNDRISTIAAVVNPGQALPSFVNR